MVRMVHLGERVYRLRKLQNITQREVSEGVTSLSNYRNLENKHFLQIPSWASELERKLNVSQGFLSDAGREDEESLDLLYSRFLSCLHNEVSSATLESLLLDPEVSTSLVSEHILLHLYTASLYREEAWEEADDYYHFHLNGSVEDTSHPYTANQLFTMTFHFMQGVVAYKHSKWERSAYHYRKIVSETEDVNIKGWGSYYLACVYLASGKIDLARNTGLKSLNYFRMMDNEEGYIKAIYILSRVELRAKNTGTSIKHIKNLFAKAVHSSHEYYATFAYGQLAESIGQFHLAVAIYRKALQQCSNDDWRTGFQIYKALVQLLLNQNDYTRLHHLFSHPKFKINSSSKYYRWILLFAEYHYEVKDFHVYLSEIQKAISYMEYHGQSCQVKDTYKIIGDYHYDIRKYKEASSWYQKMECSTPIQESYSFL